MGDVMTTAITQVNNTRNDSNAGLPRRLTLLGSTGSVGCQVLDVVAQHPDQFVIHALTAYRSIDRLFDQCVQFKPERVVIVDPKAAQRFYTRARAAGLTMVIDSGMSALVDVATATDATHIVSAIVGAAGLVPTLAALRHGKTVLLANKEPLVMCGDLMMQAVRDHQATLIPIDSEHNGVLQCLPPDYRPGHSGAAPISGLILTASGGAVRDIPQTEFSALTPEAVNCHPNWSMGPKITVDSATMMNKGFEVIEAYWLFQLPTSAIEVVLHPQSIIHAMVRFKDGSLLAQLASHDMRVPISVALAWPNRLRSGVDPLNLMTCGPLSFMPVSSAHYPCLALAYEALSAGQSSLVTLNAANEVAVAAFLQRRLRFDQIYSVIAAMLAAHSVTPMPDLETVLAMDQHVREAALHWIEKNAGKQQPVQITRISHPIV